MQLLVVTLLLALAAAASAKSSSVFTSITVQKLSEEQLPVEKVAAPESLTCTGCTFVVSWVESYVKAHPNATETEIQNELDTVCGYLGPYSTECTSFVNAELPQILTWLVNKTPSQICQLLHLCSSGAVAAVAAAAESTPVAIVEETAAAAVASSTLGCTACTLIATYVQTAVKANGTADEAALQASLDAFCGTIGAEAADCKTFVNNLLPQVFKWVQTESVANICSSLHLCGTSSSLSSTASLKRTVTPTVRHGGRDLVRLVEEPSFQSTSLPCSACELVFSFLDQFLQANPNATDADIEGALDAVCNLLPGAYASECNAFVTAEVPALVSYVTSYTPQQLCATLGLCSSNALVAASRDAQIVKDVRQVEGDSAKCSVCKVLMTFVQTYFKAHKNDTLSELEKVADGFCAALPSPYNVTCEALVKVELPTVFGQLLTDTPDQLCKIVKLCSSLTSVAADGPLGLVAYGYSAHAQAQVQVPALPPTANVQFAPAVNLTINCPLCKFLMSLVQQWASVQPSLNKTSLLAKVDEYCGLVPKFLQKNCVNVFAPKAVAIAKSINKDTPEQLCQKIGSCVKSSKLIAQALAAPTTSKSRVPMQLTHKPLKVVGKIFKN